MFYAEMYMENKFKYYNKSDKNHSNSNCVCFSLYSSPSKWYLILGAVCISTLYIHLQGLCALLLAVLGQAGVGSTAALGYHIIICEVNGEVGAGRGWPRCACQ